MTKRSTTPDHKFDPEQTPAAQPREGSPLDSSQALVDEIAHRQGGAADPAPSVQQAFAALPPVEAPASEDGSVYRGPFLMTGHVSFLDPKTNKRVDLSPRMPLTDGGRGPRVIQRGDIPDDLVQDLYARGVLRPVPPPLPKPKPAARPAAAR